MFKQISRTSYHAWALCKPPAVSGSSCPGFKSMLLRQQRWQIIWAWIWFWKTTKYHWMKIKWKHGQLFTKKQGMMTIWSTEMNFLLQMPEWSYWNVKKLIMFLSPLKLLNDSPQPSQSVPVPSSNTGILVIRSCYFCSLRRCLCPGVHWRQPAQHPSALPASATGLSFCLECSCELSLKTVELLDTCHSEVTFSAKQQQLNSLP